MIAPRELIRAFGKRPTKALGQHFLTDSMTISEIAKACRLKPGMTAIEIGPGPGVLTSALLDTGAEVFVIEKDRRAVRHLQGAFTALHPTSADRLHVIEGDATTLTLSEAIPDFLDRECVVVGNLPYNVGTPILMNLLEERAHLTRGVFMFQKEVAERVAATAGTRKYGSLSLAVRARARVKVILDVPPGKFSPPPKVDSAVVSLRFPDTPAVPLDILPTFERVAKAAFTARRKTISNSLKQGLSCSSEDVLALLKTAEIDPKLRPEKVDLAHYLALTRAWMEFNKS